MQSEIFCGLVSELSRAQNPGATESDAGHIINAQKTREPMDRWRQADVYTNLATRWARHQLPTPTLAEREELYQHFCDLFGEERIAPLRERLLANFCNQGFYGFMRDYGGASPVGFQWLVNVANTKPDTLECSFNHYWSIEDPQRAIRLDDNDIFSEWVPTSTTFYEATRRGILAAQALENAKSSDPDQPAQILMVGEGRFPELRYTGFAFEPERQQIYAIDKDPEIDAFQIMSDPCLTPDYTVAKIKGEVVPVAEYLAQNEDSRMSDFGFFYGHMTIDDLFRSRWLNTCEGESVLLPKQYDVIVMNGLAIYLSGKLPLYLEKLGKLLKPGGKLIWDFSLTGHWDLLRAGVVWGWGLGEKLASPDAVLQAYAKMSGHDFANDPDKMIDMLAKIFRFTPVEGENYLLETMHDPVAAIYFEMTHDDLKSTPFGGLILGYLGLRNH